MHNLYVECLPIHYRTAGTGTDKGKMPHAAASSAPASKVGERAELLSKDSPPVILQPQLLNLLIPGIFMYLLTAHQFSEVFAAED